MKHVFILNGKAGTGTALTLISDIERLCRVRQFDYEIKISERPGHVEELARAAATAGRSRVYAVGGDGTIHEVLNGIFGSGSSLAVIPAGSGNDFFRCLGDNQILGSILEKTLDGIERPVDTARLNGRLFLNISSIGVDAEAARYSGRLRNVPLFGGASYFLGAFEAIMRSKVYPVQVWMDDHYFAGEMLLAAIANGRFYGRGMLPVPEARIDDGWLDICLITPMSRLRMLAFFPKYIKGQHGEMPEVSFFKARKVTIRCEQESAMMMDGEASVVREAVFDIIPQGIPLVTPEFR